MDEWVVLLQQLHPEYATSRYLKTHYERFWFETLEIGIVIRGSTQKMNVKISGHSSDDADPYTNMNHDSWIELPITELPLGLIICEPIGEQSPCAGKGTHMCDNSRMSSEARLGSSDA